MIDQSLLGAVAENIVNLAVPREHGGAEINELRGEIVGILIARVHPLGSKAHDARVVRQNAGGHKGVLRTVAAEVHTDVDAPRFAGLG